MSTFNSGKVAAHYAVDTTTIGHQVSGSTDERYGMSEADYQAYLEDCRESAEVYEDIYHFITHDPDVASYLF